MCLGGAAGAKCWVGVCVCVCVCVCVWQGGVMVVAVMEVVVMMDGGDGVHVGQCVWRRRSCWWC
jgi:hypothetical protein